MNKKRHNWVRPPIKIGLVAPQIPYKHMKCLNCDLNKAVCILSIMPPIKIINNITKYGKDCVVVPYGCGQEDQSFLTDDLFEI